MANTRQDKMTEKKGTGKNRVLLIIIIIILIFILALPFLAVYSYYKASYFAARQYQEMMDSEELDTKKDLDHYHFQDDFVVNGADGSQFYIALSLGYHKNDEISGKEIREKQFLLRDIINRILAAKRKDKLATVVGQLELREEIRATSNSILSRGRVEAVVFDKFEVR